MSEHRMGKYTGYTIDGDKVYPAPLHVAAMERLRAQGLADTDPLLALSLAQRAIALEVARLQAKRQAMRTGRMVRVP